MAPQPPPTDDQHKPSQESPPSAAANHQPPTTNHPFRWQALFQRVGEPLFVLDRKRRILFVNRAFEELTGVQAEEARGLACTRRTATSTGVSGEVARALWPPAEVQEGKSARARRQVAGATSWWEIEYLPFRGEEGLLCILGKISGLPIARTAGFVPFPEALRTLHTSLAAKLPEPEAEMLWRPEKLVALRERLAGLFRLDQLESELPVMRRVLAQVKLASQIRACVFIVGETGSGKQWLARTIHQEGQGRERAFAALDCARLPPAALAEALFGEFGLCKRSGIGSLYLKEPSRLPHDLQSQVSDWMDGVNDHQDCQRPRLLVGSIADPISGVQAGRMLEKLHATLATVVIELPSLRERLADLPSLVDRMLERLNAESERRIVGLTPAAWEMVREYRWPGNLRELHSVLAGCHARAGGERIDVADLPAFLRQAVRLEQVPAGPSDRPMPLDQFLQQAERRLLELALRRARGNKSRAAELLAVWRPRLLRRMEALGIEGSKEGGS